MLIDPGMISLSSYIKLSQFILIFVLLLSRYGPGRIPSINVRLNNRDLGGLRDRCLRNGERNSRRRGKARQVFLRRAYWKLGGITSTSKHYKFAEIQVDSRSVPLTLANGLYLRNYRPSFTLLFTYPPPPKKSEFLARTILRIRCRA